MTAYRLIATACLAAAVGLTALLVAPPAQGHPGHKPGPVCKWKDRHHKSCVVVLAPKGKAQQVVVIDLDPLPKQV